MNYNCTLRRLLAMVMVVCLCLSSLPLSIFAAGEKASYKKITTAEELTTGQYVLVSDAGYALGQFDKGWISAVQPTIAGDTVTDAMDAVWTITVDGNTAKLTDKAGTTISPKKGNNNGILSGDYSWEVAFSNGTFTFNGQGDDTTILAGNKQFENKFRAYKDATVSGSPSSYAFDFTLYKLSDGGSTPDVTEPVPTESIPTEPPVTEPEVTEPSGTIVSVKDALALADGEKATVKGVVTLVDGLNYYVQDETGAICVRLASPAENVQLGDTLIGTGVKGAFNGVPQLNNGTFEKSTGLTLKAKDTTIGALTKNDICTYVKISDVEVTDVYDNNGQYKAPNITVKDANGGTIQLYKAVIGKNEDGSWAVKVGDKLNITAAVSAFNEKLQLRNTNASEVEIQTGGGETPQPGNKVPDGTYVIWAPGHNKALSTTYNGFYNKGVDVTLTGDKLTGYAPTEVWTVANNEDGSVSISCADGKLSMDTGFSSTPLNKANDKWLLEDAGDGLFYLKNMGRSLHLQWYSEKSNWSAFTFSEENKANFALKFTPAEQGNTVDSSVVSNIAQWGGMTKADNTTSVKGDLYKGGDELDAGAIYSVVVNGKPTAPWSKGGQPEAPLYYMGGVGLGSGSNDYIQLAVNSAGWADMSLSFRLRSTKSAAGEFTVQYSTDGQTFHNFTTGSYTYKWQKWGKDEEGNSSIVDSGTAKGDITNGVAKTSMNAGEYIEFTFDVPAGAENAKNLMIRLVPGKTRADGKDGTISDRSSVRMDSVILSGSPIVSNNITGHVTASPNGSEDQAVGTAITLTSKTADAVISYRMNGGAWKTYNAESKPTLDQLPCDLEVKATAPGKADSVKLLYHYSAGTVSTVKMDPNGGSVYIDGDSTTVTLSCETPDATIFYAIDGGEYAEYTAPITLKKGFGKMEIKTYAAKAGFNNSAEISRTFTERNSATYNIYFGQLHAHTSYSDGAGTCREAFEHATKVKNLDFLAVTDHSNSFDNCDQASLADGSMSAEWKEGHELADQFTTDSFVGLYGFEMTWSNGLGHINTFNTPGFQSRTQEQFKTYGTALQNYYAALKTQTGSISQFNHPGTTFGDFSDFAHYDNEIDQLITLIEVGNGEGEIGSSGYFPSYEYYTRALDKGWHIAPTNNQDNHKGRWGDANTARSVVLADSLSQTGIYDAMRNYRVYATEDNDLSIYYTLNNQVMGSTLSVPSGEELNLSVKLSDPTDASIGKVEVIVNGGLTAASASAATNNETVTFTLPNNYSYYYIKVTQPDGNIAVTAPVWTGKVEAVGISSFKSDAVLPVQNQEMNLTLDLFNNEKTDLEISKVQFTIGDKVIHTADASALSKVPGMGTATYTFPYTHNGLGATAIYATVTGSLNGVEKVYTEKLDLNFVTADMVTRVVVDGTHFNDYVSGYYGGNMNNLAAIGADSQIEVKVVTDEITEAILSNCDLLIVSAPARNAGTANAGDYTAKPFEDSFIKLVTDYVQNGGSLVVCGLADYQDKKAENPAYETSAQLNKLLAAVGSSMTVNDDEAYDEVNNGGQPYRLYPETFNTASPWCANIKEGQKYSQYSGCTVNAGKGTWLVKGFDSTYSIDSDGDGKGGVAKGDAVFMAYEPVGKGHVFAAGGVFVSDFEVKAEMDNIWDLPYANRTIIENIMNSVRVELPVSTIAEVRAGQMNDVFRIQGYVTAGTDNEHNKFFDAIYVQDDTAGITVFPFSQLGVPVGTPIDITGYVDAYQGDKEIQIMSYKILDTEPKVYQPKKMSNKDAMDYDKNGGSLIQVEGEVVEVDYTKDGKGVSQFVVKDRNGDLAKVFIDGYILSGTTGQNNLASIVKMGNTVSGVGLLYLHPEGSSDVSIPVLRVRNCDEILLVNGDGTDPTVPPTEEPGETPTDPSPDDTTQKPTEKPDGTTPDTSKPDGTAPQTGDTIGVVVVVMVVALCVGALMLWLLSRKKNSNS